MILSVSRRTDIPAFYSEWFFNRLREGYAYIRNPMNYHQVSKVSLSPSEVECIVFWTKDPSKMLDKLHLLAGYHYYFQVTITPYDRKIERNVPAQEVVVDAFKNLSRRIGSEKVIWRYDPIMLTSEYDLEYHAQSFKTLASELEGYTQRCVISFMDLYKKSKRNLQGIGGKQWIDEPLMFEIAKRLSEIARRYHFRLETCSETIDLSALEITPSKCIDDQLISEIIGEPIHIDKDKNQRGSCGCVESIDIGSYNSCPHGCLYCYANYSDVTVKNNIAKHCPDSPMLLGNVNSEEDKITLRKMRSLRKQVKQLTFEGF